MNSYYNDLALAVTDIHTGIYVCVSWELVDMFISYLIRNSTETCMTQDQEWPSVMEIANSQVNLLNER